MASLAPRSQALSMARPIKIHHPSQLRVRLRVLTLQEAMEEEEAVAPPEQWRGAVEAALPGTPAGTAWAHVASFCSAHRYLPGIDVCERVAGEGDGLPGCVRHVASVAGGLWAREELLESDHDARRLRYAVVDSNMGFGRYIATLRVLDGVDGDGGCRIAWAFECEAVQGEGWSEAALVARLDASVKGMAERVQQAVAAAGLQHVREESVPEANGQL